MIAPEQARLLLAQRAYRAAEPSVAEVQAGVRRARLAQRRPRRSRALLGKALVMVVLAMGGLAYAKPNALGEIVSGALSLMPKGHATPSAALAVIPALPPSELAAPAGRGTHHAPGTAPLAGVSATEGTTAAEAPNAAAATGATAAPNAAATGATATPNAAAAGVDERQPASSQRGPADKRRRQRSQSDGSQTASEWSHVGKALAQGNEQAAFDALDALARSDDQRTRDKAELGRAQLLLARGDRDQACAVARSLTQRRAGDRIERQALALLKSCTR